jgi:hypothetical protein
MGLYVTRFHLDESCMVAHITAHQLKFKGSEPVQPTS